MVSPDRNERAAFAQGNEVVQHAPAVRAPVDVVAQGDDGIVRGGLRGVDQSFQGHRVTVDIAIAIIRAMLLCLSGWMRLIRPLATDLCGPPY